MVTPDPILRHIHQVLFPVFNERPDVLDSWKRVILSQKLTDSKPKLIGLINCDCPPDKALDVGWQVRINIMSLTLLDYPSYHAVPVGCCEIIKD